MTFQQILQQEKIETPIPCPFHVVQRPDGTLGQELFPSCFINKEKQLFNCFGCGTSGSFIKLKCLLEDIPYEQAKWDIYKGEIPPWLYREEEEFIDPSYAESFLSPFHPAGEIEERKVSEKATSFYGIRRDKENNLIIPYRDKGALKGLQVRYNTKEENTNWYDQLLFFRRSSILFGEQLETDKTIILCEGALDAVKLYSVLEIPALAINGAIVTKRQLELLSKRSFSSLVWWADNDEPGRRNIKKNWDRLKKISNQEVYTINYQEGDKKDPSEEDEKRIKEQWENRIWIPITF